MKTLLIAVSLFASSAFAGEIVAGVPDITPLPRVCGELEASMSEGQLYLNLADRSSLAGKQENYNVTNPNDFDWISGSCVCLGGLITSTEDGYLYKNIQVADVQEDGAKCEVLTAPE